MTGEPDTEGFKRPKLTREEALEIGKGLVTRENLFNIAWGEKGQSLCRKLAEMDGKALADVIKLLARIYFGYGFDGIKFTPLTIGIEELNPFFAKLAETFYKRGEVSKKAYDIVHKGNTSPCLA